MSNARDRILARRARFMAAAIVGIAGCSSSETGSPQVCLKTAPDAAMDAGEAEPQPCLFAGPEDTSITDSSSDVSDTNGDG
jgi:hypothetical protein